MIELYNNTPLFPGQNEKDERDIIFRKLGTPNLSTMPKLASYPEWNASIPIYPGVPLNELVPRMDNNALDLLSVSKQCGVYLQRLLTYDPDRRIDCQQALNHPYFNGFDSTQRRRM